MPSIFEIGLYCHVHSCQAFCFQFKSSEMCVCCFVNFNEKKKKNLLPKSGGRDLHKYHIDTMLIISCCLRPCIQYQITMRYWSHLAEPLGDFEIRISGGADLTEGTRQRV